ncbi:hypothetical protein B296_00019309 [Ensete ventricosum]|uniref:Retrotransposon gag domain-containing protein n=1 Tax=Ensete ventricosum TaxID=4639 RepID=A0A426YZE9_ENSVE|nr:hypothetical protein B296_00019309 [Ensete ventricosum]
MAGINLQNDQIGMGVPGATPLMLKSVFRGLKLPPPICIGRTLSLRKSQHGETLDQRDDPQEHGHITFDLNNPYMKVDFPRWEEGEPIGWSSTRSTIFYSTKPPMPHEIAAIYLEGDAIQWFNWFEHTHGGLSWQRFKEGLLNHFRPTDFDNIDASYTCPASQSRK